jgi:glucokinase
VKPVATVLAMDIGGSKLATGVVHSTGRVEGLLIEPTLRDEGPVRVISRLFAQAHRSLLLGDPGISAIGIACGGPLDPVRGIVQSPPHLPGWVDIPLVAMAEREFGIQAVLENDATAAAWGEFRFGAAYGSQSMIYLTVSTGIGGGAVFDRRLHRGAAGNGGEFGHVLVRSGGRRCVCGRRGCLEAYASGTSIAARAVEQIAAGATSVLTGFASVTAADVAAAAAVGDPVARAVWSETTELLGSAITDLVNAFEPEMVVLGGGVTGAGSALLEPVAEIVLRDAMPPAAAAVRFAIAASGESVGVVGAGAIALDRDTQPSKENVAASGGPA